MTATAIRSDTAAADLVRRDRNRTTWGRINQPCPACADHAVTLIGADRHGDPTVAECGTCGRRTTAARWALAVMRGKQVAA